MTPKQTHPEHQSHFWNVLEAVLIMGQCQTSCPHAKRNRRWWKQSEPPLLDLGLKTHSQHGEERKKGAGNTPGR